jgi:hypothetical protein
MKKQVSASAFGQAEPTDNRDPYDWKSKYDDPKARKGMGVEAIYLGCLLFGMPLIMLACWLEYPKNLLHLSDQKYRPLLKYAFAWSSGTLGGVLFDIKWLYHSVARGSWHLDRRLWRIFTPHISGGLSFFVLALISSGALRIFDRKATESFALVVGLGFLVGYFSDSAIAKLTELAETLFGTIRAKEKHKDAPISGDPDTESSKKEEKDPQ